MDNRLIEQIEDYNKGLNLVNEMKPITYKMKGQPAKNVGLISQDIQKLEPLTVTRTSQGTLSINYDELVVILINAVKELKAEVEELKAKKTKSIK